jgi:hypothetical protein
MNRDALALQTPEGCLLKKFKTLKPDLVLTCTIKTADIRLGKRVI